MEPVFSIPKGLCRIYYFKAGIPVSARDQARNDEATRALMAGKLPSDQTYNPVRMLGTNASWTEIGSKDYDTKIRNLLAMRDSSGVAYCVFTSEWFGERSVDEVIQSLLGAAYPAGFYEF